MTPCPRFRLSDSARAQRFALNVPFTILELLAQPRLTGASRLLDQDDLAVLSPLQREQARVWLGLYVVSDGKGTITGIYRMPHRKGCDGQDKEMPQLAARTRFGWMQHQALASVA
ncbi:hypothetical protein [Chitinilyticum piscinae]|uniref:Uncharacterized protein n=1 Tax=Chitinilyticum piscinae TaxID=2866724 RepID=A0A8J7FIA0_9NEIS|nr:hypothetical protein [Chitinilyticum piscinae]MBE9608715.1 hypothetical protein [Chitinilyticum piscinae]